MCQLPSKVQRLVLLPRNWHMPAGIALSHPVVAVVPDPQDRLLLLSCLRPVEIEYTYLSFNGIFSRWPPSLKLCPSRRQHCRWAITLTC